MTDTPHEQEPGTDFDSQDTLLDGSLILAEFPSELLVILAEKVGKFGNPLALLVSKAHLSKAFCGAARKAQATLTRADLREWARTVDGAVKAVASGCPQLTSLYLAGCRHVTDAAVVAVASGCPQLSSFDLGDCKMMTDAAVVAVASKCKKLTTLKLDCCGDISDTAVVAVASGCKRLTVLDLTYCHKITDVAVVAVASGCKQLTSLNLHGCENITDAAKSNIPKTIRF